MKDDISFAWGRLPLLPLVQAGVVGSVEVPLYIPEDEVSPAAFLKKATAFGMGGWWIGGTHMKPNPGFMRELVAKVPKDSKIILGCQKGLRYQSLISSPPQSLKSASIVTTEQTLYEIQSCMSGFSGGQIVFFGWSIQEALVYIWKENFQQAL